MTSHSTPESYRGFLTRVYGFESPVEAVVLMTSGIERILDLRGRAHLRLLASDLVTLGVDVQRLPRCRNVAPFRTIEDALGWLYVLGRNTLLHGILRRHLVKKLPELTRSSSYLAGNESAIGGRMRELGAALDATARTPGSVDRIIVAAHAAFRCQRHWFAEAIPPRAQVA